MSKDVGKPVEFDAKKKRLFLVELVRYGNNKTKACEAVGISRMTFSRHIRKDPEFAAAVEDAIEQIGDMLEEEVVKRALYGVEKPITYMGQHISTVMEPCNDMLKLAVTRFRKKEYAKNDVVTHEGQIEHKVKVEGIRESILGKFDKLAKSKELIETIEAQIIEAEKPKELEDLSKGEDLMGGLFPEDAEVIEAERGN